jgi:hypothetical protein
VAEAPLLKPSPDGTGDRKSSRTSSDFAPSGTVQWNAYMSILSRSHATGFPPAESLSPARLSIGPVGPCSPGSHFG